MTRQCLWTLEKLRKTIFCYKMITFSLYNNKKIGKSHIDLDDLLGECDLPIQESIIIRKSKEKFLLSTQKNIASKNLRNFLYINFFFFIKIYCILYKKMYIATQFSFYVNIIIIFSSVSIHFLDICSF